MKRILLIIALAAFTNSFAQDFDALDKSTLDAAYYPAKAAKRRFAVSKNKKMALEPKIRVLYSRPLKKGREIFGKLVKYNKPWRVGANESTEILFMTPVKLGDTEVDAGRYTIIIIPTVEIWTLKLNTGLDGWGNYSYDETLDIATVSANVQHVDNVIEALSIALYEKSENLVHLKIGWDQTIVEFPIELK